MQSKSSSTVVVRTVDGGDNQAVVVLVVNGEELTVATATRRLTRSTAIKDVVVDVDDILDNFDFFKKLVLDDFQGFLASLKLSTCFEHRLAISNLFRGVYFENNHEYTLRKNSLKLFGLLRNFLKRF